MANTAVMSVAAVLVVVLVVGLIFYQPYEPLSQVTQGEMASSLPQSEYATGEDAAGNIIGSQVAFSQLNNGGIGNTVGLQSVVGQALTIGTATTFNLPVTEPDANYGVVCETNFLTTMSVTGKTTTQFTLNYPNVISSQTADCLIWHP